MDTTHHLENLVSSGTVNIVTFAFALFLIYYAIYHKYFDSLSIYPGPKLWAVSSLPRAFFVMDGTLPYKLLEIHEKYGPVVRIGPSDLSYSSEEAWLGIYGRQKGEKDLAKDPSLVRMLPEGERGLGFVSSEKAHSRMRRVLAGGFSDKALRAQESLVQNHISILISRIQQSCIQGPIDVISLFTFLTSDISGELTLGQSFNSLSTSDLHPWALNKFKYSKYLTICTLLLRFWPVSELFMWIMSMEVFRKGQRTHRETSNEKLAQRLEHQDERVDFITPIQASLDTPGGFSLGELQDTVSNLFIAGSEAVSTVLASSLFFLTKNPEKLDMIVNEIRNRFTTEGEISMVSINDLKYTTAVIEETLRILPPAAQQFSRITPPGGCLITGKFVPENTIISVATWSTSHLSSNFADPFKFVPERYLKVLPKSYEKYATDNKNAYQAFSVGPRNCIGKGLAYLEMKLVLARLLWSFDVSLTEESKQWLDKPLPSFGLYDKGRLIISFSKFKRV